MKDHELLVTPGAISAIFYILNTFSGKTEGENKKRKILLPQCPDFADYQEMGVDRDCYYSFKNEICITGNHSFRYNIDYKKIDFNDIGLVLL